jgi:cell division septum initiation protein DivIVA
VGLLNDLFVKIKGDNKDLKGKLKDSEQDVKGFSGAVKGIGASMAAAAAAGAAAFTVILRWIKDTSFGVEAMNVALGASKQLLTDLIMGNGLHIKEAIENARLQSKIQNDDIKEGYIVKKMQSELAQLIRAAADQTLSHSERLKVLTQAMEKEKQLKEFLLADAREELSAAYENWRLNLASLEAKRKYYEVAGRIKDIEGMDSRRLQSQFTGELKAQEERAKALVEAFTPLPEDIAEANRQMSLFVNKTIDLADTFKMMSEIDLSHLKMPSFGVKAGNTLAGAPSQPDKGDPNLFGGFNAAEQWKQAWEGAIMEVTSLLSDEFTKVFESIGKGSFKGFGQELLGNFGSLISSLGKMLVSLGTTMLLALTLLKTPSIPTAIAAIAAGAAAMAIGGTMMGMAQGANLGGGGGSSGGGGGQGISSQQMKVIVEGKIRGKDIVIASRRYEESGG